MGFDWKTDVTFIGGFAAKEIVVSTLGTVYSMREIDSDRNAVLLTLTVKRNQG